MLTSNDIIQAAREMAFDRFPVPVLLLRSDDAKTAESSLSGLTVKNGSNIEVSLSYAQYDTVGSIFANLFSNSELGIAIPATYVEREPSSEILPITAKPLNPKAALSRRYGVSIMDIEKMINRYMIYYYKFNCSCLGDADKFLATRSCGEDEHLTIWLAYHIVERLRDYFAAQELDITWTNDEEGFCQVNSAGAGFIKRGSLSVSVADVFSFSDEDSKPLIEKVEAVGAVNMWGDDGFWYRLQLRLRGMFEKLFGDFSLQPSQVAFSQIIMDKDQSYYAWFDSYPYEFGSYVSNIIKRCDA